MVASAGDSAVENVNMVLAEVVDSTAAVEIVAKRAATGFSEPSERHTVKAPVLELSLVFEAAPVVGFQELSAVDTDENLPAAEAATVAGRRELHQNMVESVERLVQMESVELVGAMNVQAA